MAIHLSRCIISSVHSVQQEPTLPHIIVAPVPTTWKFVGEHISMIWWRDSARTVASASTGSSTMEPIIQTCPQSRSTFWTPAPIQGGRRMIGQGWDNWRRGGTPTWAALGSWTQSRGVIRRMMPRLGHGRTECVLCVCNYVVRGCSKTKFPWFF